MSDFGRHFGGAQEGGTTSQSRARVGARAEDEARADAVAIVGVGCRFPSAQNPEEFWRLLEEGRDAVTEVPAERWDASAYYSEGAAEPGRMSTRWGGFVRGVGGFDAQFFGVTPREAQALDPQQRLVLEVAWEALEGAGIAADGLSGSDAGVFIGICTGDYAQLHRVLDDPERITPYYGTGNAYSFAAGRLSYLLGLHGPSLAVDTACSSSLVAVHLACQSLRQRECSLALAGGVNLILSPTGSIYVSQVRAVAADGRCKTFDAAADGYVRGEGCGVVVLKRLSDAVSDGDDVLAVIRGSAVNQDGRSAGLTAPSGRAQAALIRRALACAGLDPARVSYVEAHGTGTSLGDPIEVRALGEALCEGRPAERPLMLGSVKTNIGHLEAAAGVAGLIKTVLSLRRGALPASLHFKTPSPHIPWDEFPLGVPTRLTPWETFGESRVAGVSSFGFSGTNAHVVLEEAPAPAGAARADDRTHAAARAQLVPLSARSVPALRALAASYESFLRADAPALEDLSHTAALRRAHHAHRAAFVAGSVEELREHLAAYARGQERAGASSGQAAGGRRCRVAFVYPGQGAQWWAMGRQLLDEEPVFRAAVEECEALVGEAAGWSVLAELTAPQEESRLDGADIEVTQVTLFAVQVALTALWRAWGVEPDAVVGHSMGEVAAAWACGALGLRDAVRVICARARLLQSATQKGAMAAAAVGAEEARAAMGGFEGRVSIGADNSPGSCVLSGAAEAVEEVVGRLERDGVYVRRLRTTGVAGHSPQVEGVRAELEAALAGLRPARPRIRMASTVTGESVAGAELDARYWGRNLRETVRFRQAVARLAREGYGVYLEVGVHPVLVAAAEETLREAGAEGAGGRAPRVCWTLQRGEPERAQMLHAAAQLYAEGYRLDWAQLTGGRGRLVPLPHYPWQRQRFWIEEPAPRPEPLAVAEGELDASPQLRETVEGLLRRWPAEGARAVNRAELAPNLFLASDRRSLFYFSREGSSVTTLIYVGPEEAYEPLVKEAAAYASARGLQLNVLAEERRAGALRRLNFTTTPLGVLQSIPDLAAFRLDGNRMRRLRYQFKRYAESGDCSTVEYAPGRDPRVDEEVAALIEAWLGHKGRPASSVRALKGRILGGSLGPHQRLFLTRRAGALEGAVILSPAPGGYLMDLEFYGPRVPAGCLEYTVVRIVEQLRAEGCTYLSLGGTYGTGLAPHTHADPAAAELFAALHREGVLNGDGNFQFKNKFRPEASALYLCRPAGSSPDNLGDVLLTLTDSEHKARGGFKTGAAPARARAAGDSLPLAGRRLDTPLREVIFESELSADGPASFAGHRVRGRTLLPGTAYLEMALEAAASVSGEGPCALKEVAVNQPLLLPPGESRTVQLVLRPAAAGEHSFEVFSLDEEEKDGRWRSHALGVVSKAEARPASSPSLEEARARCREEVAPEEYYAWLAAQGVEYGPGFRALGEVWRAPGEALGRARLRGEMAVEAGAYLFHPALLDACFQVLGVAGFGDPRRGAARGLYLLRGLEALRVYGRGGGALWSHAVVREGGGASDELLVGDVRLFDEAGHVVAEVEGLCAKRVEAGALPAPAPRQVDEWLYEVRWQAGEEAAVRAHAPSSNGNGRAAADSPPGSWLIFADEGGVGERLAEQLGARGEKCRVVRAGRSAAGEETRRFVADPARPDEFERLLREWAGEGGDGPRRVVHLWSLDAEDAARLDAERLGAASLAGCGSALQLVRAAARAPFAVPPRLWLVTRGAQPGGPVTGVAQSALWGLGRVIASEHPELWGGLVDLGGGGARDEAAALLGELFAHDGEDNVAFREGRRAVARLARRGASERGAGELRLAAEASYLVTGGLGGLGLAAAEWMVRRGARRIFLVGRRGAQGAPAEAVERMKRAGAEVSVGRLDVGDAAQVSRLVGEIEGAGRPLRGVIHAAGVIDDQSLAGQSWERFAAVLRPKVQGAWNLHAATLRLPLDFFVLFSSAAALLGPPGQGNHAAANAFMDALAHHRRARGLPALSVNWGVWSEVGLAAELGVAGRVAALGMDGIGTEEGLLALERLMRERAVQAAVLPVDWRRWGESRRGAPAPPLLRELLGRAEQAGAAEPDGREPSDDSLREAVRDAGPERGRALLEQYVREEAAGLMGLPASELDVRQPLNQLGFDSLMSINLKNRIERVLGVRLPVVSFFRDPCVSRLAERLAEELCPQVRKGDAEELLARLDLMSDGEVDSLLAELKPAGVDI